MASIYNDLLKPSWLGGKFKLPSHNDKQAMIEDQGTKAICVHSVLHLEFGLVSARLKPLHEDDKHVEKRGMPKTYSLVTISSHY